MEPAFDLVDEGLGARVDPTRPAIVRAYLPARDPPPPRRRRHRVADALGHLQAFGLRPIGELRTRIVHEADWADAWKAYFPVLRVGRRLVIRPTWRRHRRVGDDVVLALDPGMAFGTGLHPTTRLCLAMLEASPTAGTRSTAPASSTSGAGPGILAIAAIRSGPSRAVGVDTDPIAIEATAANARRNGWRDGSAPARAACRAASPPSMWCLANLIAGVLVPLAAPLHDELRPAASSLASGIFIDREAEVRARLRDGRARWSTAARRR